MVLLGRAPAGGPPAGAAGSFAIGTSRVRRRAGARPNAGSAPFKERVGCHPTPPGAAVKTKRKAAGSRLAESPGRPRSRQPLGDGVTSRKKSPKKSARNSARKPAKASPSDSKLRVSGPGGDGIATTVERTRSMRPRTRPTLPAVGPIAVVGVGASAGGFEAFRQFVSAIPPDSGLAVVLIQHLDPIRQSLTAELLRRHTTMQVAEAVEDVIMEPNHVYVIPPNRYLA